MKTNPSESMNQPSSPELMQGKHGQALIFAADLSRSAKEVLRVFCDSPLFASRHIAIMPDGHPNGDGTLTGFTCLGGDEALLCIEHDAGCGVSATFIDAENDIDFAKLDKICHEIPAGKGRSYIEPAYEYDFSPLHCHDAIARVLAYPVSLGSLGGGNHFIELDEDRHGNRCLVVHNGLGYLSGACIDYYKDLASSLHGKTRFTASMDELVLTGEAKRQFEEDSAFFVRLCECNRAYIADYILNKMGWGKKRRIDVCHHYTSPRDGIIRHGAISAHLGEPVLIPVNAKQGCILGIGKGNPDWNYSAPHGGGRLFSRKGAFASFHMEEYQRCMQGIYSSTVLEGNLDEIPLAYRDLTTIVNAIAESVQITEILTPLYSYKGI